MKCKHVTQNIDLFVSQDLPAATLEAIRLHLLDCGACRAEYQVARASVEQLQALGRAELPAENWESWWQGIRAETFGKGLVQAPGPMRRLWNRHGDTVIRFAAAAAVLLLTLGVLQQWQSSQGDQTPIAERSAAQRPVVQPLPVVEQPGAMARGLSPDGEFKDEATLEWIEAYLREKEEARKRGYELDQMENNPNIRFVDF